MNVPAVDEVQERVEAPLPPPLTVTLDGESVQVKPEDGETESVRPTVPANPLRLVIVIAECPVPPDAKLKLVGLADIVKSRIV